MHPVSASKRLAWLLRHAPWAGDGMDEAGWVDIDAVIARMGIRRDEVLAVVATNDKQRFELRSDGAQIRAACGHGTALVAREALEASWQRLSGPGTCVHGTRTALVATLRAEGIRPMGRTHVHLAQDAAAHVGKRGGVSALLVVDRERLADAGLSLFQTQSGVLLARFVPPSAIIEAYGVKR